MERELDKKYTTGYDKKFSYLYIFEINSLSVASFAIIFSHSEGCLFTLLIDYAMEKRQSL